MTCKNCKRENRKIAKFCKWCGTALPVLFVDALDKLEGMESEKSQIVDMLEMYSSLKMRPETRDISINSNILILGESGTGKKMLGKVLKEVFYANNIIQQPILKIVEGTDLPLFFQDFENNIQQLKGGILLIDGAEKLVHSSDTLWLDKLFMEVAYWNNDPVLIMTGIPGELESYLAQTPAVYNRFRYTFNLKPYTSEELVGICVKNLNEEFGGLQLSEEAFNVLTEIFMKQNNLSNGHDARHVARRIYSTFYRKEANPGVIMPEDIKNIDFSF